MEIRLFTEKEQSTEDTCEGCYFYDGCCENTMFSKVCTTEKIIWKLSKDECFSKLKDGNKQVT